MSGTTSSLIYLIIDVHSAPCFTALNGSNGLISSDSSGNYQYCTWIITVPLHHNIRLNFTTFQLSDSKQFGQNLIKAFDGREEDNALLGIFTGTRPPFTVQTSGRFMLVKLTRRRSRSLCNFRGVYTSTTTKGNIVNIDAFFICDSYYVT